jgi:hypothetical protein
MVTKIITFIITQLIAFLYVGVEILAIVTSKERADHIVLVTQFRPPIGKKVLEFPAGIFIV